MGTVKGDFHYIGKNIVKIMVEGKGIEVIDLGTDVSAQDFVSTAIKEDADTIACSALLTTTITTMAEVVNEATRKGIKGKLKIMIGGPPVTQNFCDSIRADYYTADTTTASDIALDICDRKVAEI